MSGPSVLTWQQYEDLLDPLTKELSDAARWIQETRQRLIVIFEGRDTAGKGGSIDMIARNLNPRQCHVAALPAPSTREQGQWYFQRYTQHFPARGEITLFDRCWYNRAGVERVMGFATAAQVDAFLQQAPVFEKQLTDDGIVLLKYWLAVDQEKQEERFAERLEDPVKRWKLSPIDVMAREKYAEYGKARDAMFEATHTGDAPWTVVDFNDQKVGRLTLIRDLLDRLPDHTVPEAVFDLPPLGHKPRKEKYTGPVTPIESRY